MAPTTTTAQDINFGALASALASGAGAALRAGGGALPAGNLAGQGANALGGALRSAGQLGQLYQMASGFFGRGGGAGGAAASTAASDLADAAAGPAALSPATAAASRSWAQGAQRLVDATLAPEGKACLVPTLSACWKDDGCRRGVQCMIDCAPSAGPAAALKWAAGGAQGADAAARELWAAGLASFSGGREAASGSDGKDSTNKDGALIERPQNERDRQQREAEARRELRKAAASSTTVTGDVPTWSDAPRCMGVCLYAAQGNAKFEAWNACARAAFKGPEELQASGLGQCGALPAAGVAKAAAAALKTGGAAAKGAAKLFGGTAAADALSAIPSTGDDAADAAAMLAAAAQTAAKAAGGASDAIGGGSAGAALGALSQAAAAGAAALTNPALMTLLRVPAISDAALLSNPLCGAPRANLTALAVEPAAALLMPPSPASAASASSSSTFEVAAVASGAELEAKEAAKAKTTTAPIEHADEVNLYAASAAKPEDEDTSVVFDLGGELAAATGAQDGADEASSSSSTAEIVGPGGEAEPEEKEEKAPASPVAVPVDPEAAGIEQPKKQKAAKPAAMPTTTTPAAAPATPKSNNNANRRTATTKPPSDESPRRRAQREASVAAAVASEPEELSDESVMVAGALRRRRRRMLSADAPAAADAGSLFGAIFGALRQVAGADEASGTGAASGPSLLGLLGGGDEGSSFAMTGAPGSGSGNGNGNNADDDSASYSSALAATPPTPPAGRGHWHIVKGLNPTFDCFPCQQYLFSQAPALPSADSNGRKAGAADEDDDLSTTTHPDFTYRPGDPLNATYIIGWGDGARAALRAAARTGQTAAPGWRGADVKGRGAFVTRVSVAMQAASTKGAPKPVGSSDPIVGNVFGGLSVPSFLAGGKGRSLLAEEEEQEAERERAVAAEAGPGVRTGRGSGLAPGGAQRRQQQQEQHERTAAASSPSSSSREAGSPKTANTNTSRRNSRTATTNNNNNNHHRSVSIPPRPPRSPATMPSPGQWAAEYTVSGMPGKDRWFVVDAVGEDFALVLYCAEVGLPCQRGGFVLASPEAVERAPSAEATVPPEVAARFDAALARSGWTEAYGAERTRLGAWCDVPACPGVPLE
jgi:hypothetical protein